MRKLVVTLAVNGYAPRITELTFPRIRKWSEKIGADFCVINKRTRPELPANCEKFQIYDLSKDYDWTMYLDADTLVHEDAFDPTELIDKDCVLFNGIDFAGVRFNLDDPVFRRRKEKIGACSWMVMCSDWTRDVWTPPEQQDITFKHALSCIHPAEFERKFGYGPEHIVDDYLLSRNIARFGLNVKTLDRDIYPVIHCCGHFVHTYAVDEAYKLRFLKKHVQIWESHRIHDDSFIEGVE